MIALKLMVNKWLRCQNYVIFKSFENKIKPQFMIYADFKSIVVSNNNEKQNSVKPYTNNCQKHVACSYG